MAAGASIVRESSVIQWSMSASMIYKSKALGKKGTKAEYNKLVRKYGGHPLSLYKNTKANRAKRIK